MHPSPARLLCGVADRIYEAVIEVEWPSHPVPSHVVPCLGQDALARFSAVQNLHTKLEDWKVVAGIHLYRRLLPQSVVYLILSKA